MKLKQMQKRAKELEARIATLEGEIQKAEMALANFTSADESTRIAVTLENSKAELEATMSEWEGVSEEIEAIA